MDLGLFGGWSTWNFGTRGLKLALVIWVWRANEQTVRGLANF